MGFQFFKNLYDVEADISSKQELIDFEPVMKQLDEDGVSPQVYHLLKRKNKLSDTPLFFQEHVKKRYFEGLFVNLFIKSQLTKILEQFERVAIEVIPLKGTVFSERYFGDLGARATSDIDLLIKKEDLKEVVQIVETLGFSGETTQIKNHFHLSFSREIPGSPIPLTVELHWNILLEQTSQLNIGEFWNQANCYQEYKYVKELSSYHTFYFMCLHGWRHNMDSCKYFLDLIQLIEFLGDELDYDVLFTDAKRHKTLKRMVRTLSIVYYHFPHLNNIASLPIKRSVMWWEAHPVMKNKHPRKREKYFDFLDYQFLSYDTVYHTIREMGLWLSSGSHRKLMEK